MAYHPDYFLDDGKSHRNDCFRRLEVLKKHVKGDSLVDIGCSGGYYSFGMNSVLPDIVAIDNVQSLIDGCISIQNREHTNISFYCDNVADFLDKSDRHWDNVFYLSVHHHIISQMGLDDAAFHLRRISERCDRMFFDMGQKNENGCTGHSWWQMLPSLDDSSQEEWLRAYLDENTRFQTIDVIGSSPIHGVQRLLWKMET